LSDAYVFFVLFSPAFMSLETRGNTTHRSLAQTQVSALKRVSPSWLGRLSCSYRLQFSLSKYRETLVSACAQRSFVSRMRTASSPRGWTVLFHMFYMLSKIQFFHVLPFLSLPFSTLLAGPHVSPSAHLLVCLPAKKHACLPLCLPACLLACLSVCLFVCFSTFKALQLKTSHEDDRLSILFLHH
jgi:hypothetical protein